MGEDDKIDRSGKSSGDENTLEKSGRSDSRGQPMIDNDIISPPRRSRIREEQKIEEEAEEKRGVKIGALEQRKQAGDMTYEVQQAAPPNLEEGSYVRPQPGAVAVNGALQRHRSSGGLENLSTLESTTNLEEPVHPPPGLLSTIAHALPISATLVERSRPSVGDARKGIRDVPLGVVLRDRRVMALLCLGFLAIIGLAIGLGISLSQKQGDVKGDDAPAEIFTDAPGTPKLPPVTSGAPVTAPTPGPTVQSVEQYLASVSPDGGAALRNATSPQRRAFLQLQFADESIANQGFLLEQKYASQVLRFGILDTAGVDITSNQFDRWRMDVDTLDECTWHHFSCNGFNRVVSIDMTYHDLVFTLPEELVLLSQLRSLSFLGNNGYGTLPTVLANLNLLEEMQLSSNSWSGTFPTEIAMMDRLQNLELHHCEFTGTVPTEFGLAKALWRLDLDNNRFTGTLPSEIFANRRLLKFYASFNFLHGTIPTEVALFTSLTEIGLESNELTGTLPTELGRLTDLAHLVLYRNKLEGTIPTEYGNFREIKNYFDLSENSLTGSIPSELSLLTKIYGDFSLGDNQLNGTIPTELGRLRELNSLELGNNKLTGTIPTQLGYLNKLGKNLFLYMNNLSGTIPTEIGKLSLLRFLSIEFNPLLSGTIPTEFGNLGTMETLYVYGTNLTESVPVELCDLTGGSLTTLEVDCAMECACCDGFCY